MPESFILALILFGIALLVLLFSPLIARREIVVTEGSYGKPKQTKKVGWGSPIGLVLLLAVIGGLFTVNASFNTVPVRNVGIVTEFKNPVPDDPKTEKIEGVTGSGPEWVKPWRKVEEWDANYELWDHRSDNENRGMTVKIAGNQVAWVPVSVEYAPRAENAAQDFKDYARNRDNWIARRVYPTLENSVTNLFRTHDPLAKANVDPVTGQVNPPDMGPYKDELNRQLKNTDLGFQVRNLYIGTIVYNEETTKALQKYANLVLDNRNLGQEEKNQEVKNRITSKQATVDKQTYCLQIAEKTGGQPGLCLTGSGTGVILDATKK